VRPAAGGTRRAIVLAAGRGTRMQRLPDPPVALEPEQRAMAERGLKMLVPFHGRPFLAYTLAALADAGITDVCLVVRAGAGGVRAAFEPWPCERLRLHFAEQAEPRGSAAALLAARGFAAEEAVVVINGDNHYPADVVSRVRHIDGSGLAAFRAAALVERAGIPRERLAAFAIVQTDAAGRLTGIVEKPDPARLQETGGTALLSMTCWRFEPIIFDACRRIAPSSRGELELPDAVRFAMTAMGVVFRVVTVDAAVLDLSGQQDIPNVARRLHGRDVRL
jgi:dTDP-glucose pyrophosphorylase